MNLKLSAHQEGRFVRLPEEPPRSELGSPLRGAHPHINGMINLKKGEVFVSEAALSPAVDEEGPLPEWHRESAVLSTR